MQKNMLGKLATIILMIIMAGLFVYFYITLNRVDKKLSEMETNVTQDAAKISSIVNFFNANLNANTNQ